MTAFKKYHTFGKRLLAWIIDGLILAPIFITSRYFLDTADYKILNTISLLVYTIGFALYKIIGHGKYGQTVGKYVMSIVVYDIAEQHTIGYARAFYRESVWFLARVIGLTYLLVSQSNAAGPELTGIHLDQYLKLSLSVWFILELVTLLFTDKRRAIHDFIAGSVVIDLVEMNREDIQERQHELITSLRDN